MSCRTVVLVIAPPPVEELGLGELKIEGTECYWVTCAALNAEGLPEQLPRLTVPFNIILCSTVAYSIQWFITYLLTEQTIFTDLS